MERPCLVAGTARGRPLLAQEQDFALRFGHWHGGRERSRATRGTLEKTGALEFLRALAERRDDPREIGGVMRSRDKTWPAFPNVNAAMAQQGVKQAGVFEI